MKKYFAAILIYIIILIMQSVCSADEAVYGEEPGMKIGITGNADSQGRLIVRQYRSYINPQRENHNIVDHIHLDANSSLEFLDYKIINKSDNLKVEESNSTLIVTGNSNGVNCSVYIQMEYLMPLGGRGASDRGEEFQKGLVLYGDGNSSLPLKEYAGYFNFSQYSQEYDKSRFTLTVHKQEAF